MDDLFCPMNMRPVDKCVDETPEKCKECRWGQMVARELADYVEEAEDGHS